MAALIEINTHEIKRTMIRLLPSCKLTWPAWRVRKMYVGDIMIKHIVMWKLKDFAEGCSKEENAKKIKAMLEALKGKIEQIIYLEVGINTNSSDMAYDAVLVSEFENVERLAEYKKHPEHVKVSSFVAKVREGRVVVDYSVDA